MTYHKFSSVSGRTADGRFFVETRTGHWGPEAALRLARRRGAVGTADLTHSTGDTSGHGRGGYDRAYTLDESGCVRRPLTAYERDYDDGADVHDVCDEVEGRP